jgi:hypothetical protein
MPKVNLLWQPWTNHNNKKQAVMETVPKCFVIHDDILLNILQENERNLCFFIFYKIY